MPQMAPLSWLMLFTFFLLILMLFNTMNYFYCLPSVNNKTTTMLTPLNVTWKW